MMMTPTTAVEVPNVVLSASEIEFAWDMLPMPKEAITPNTANSMPRIIPAFLF